MTSSLQTYYQRINLAIEYINNHLSENISLTQLAEAAHFSPYHFHRIFKNLLNETVNEFTNRVRLEKACNLLKYSKQTIMDISITCGYSSTSTFSRSFKKHYHVSPSEYRIHRQIENSKISKELFPINRYLERSNKNKTIDQFKVQLIDFKERKVAFIRVYDSFREGAVLKKFDQLIKWAINNGIYEQGTIFGMSLDDIMITPKHKYRYEVCITIPDDYIVDHTEISTMIIPKCRYATTDVSGDIALVIDGWSHLYNDWLLNNDYEPEHLHALEIFKEKDQVCDWSTYNLQLCVPVKKLNSFTT